MGYAALLAALHYCAI